MTDDIADAIAVFSGASTASVSDALDMAGVNGGCLGLRALAPGLRAVGPAFTVRFEPVEPGGAASAADYVDDVPAGAVVVLDNGGRTHCTVWGDILARIALARGIRGTVIDGLCRDAADIIRLRYPMFSLGAYMKSGKNRVRMVEVGGAVQVGGTTVRPGDVVCADDAGVIVVPADLVRETTSRVREIEAMEKAVLLSVEAGERLADARRRHGYNRFSLDPNAHPASR